MEMNAFISDTFQIGFWQRTLNCFSGLIEVLLLLQNEVLLVH